MRFFAHVDDATGVVQTILMSPDDQPPVLVPEAPAHVMVDVTDLSPQPASGWTYNGSVFSPPVADVNRDALLSKAQQALQGNLAYLALNPPTTAQALTQVDALTRQINALIRLVAHALDSTDGT